LYEIDFRSNSKPGLSLVFAFKGLSKFIRCQTRIN